MINIRDNWFVDDHNRVVMLRGVNLGGSSKVPFSPDGSTYHSEGFFNHRSVSFKGRPFPLEEADEHYTRLREWGFNCLRFLITWEAVEHAGPGIYDEEYLNYLYLVVKKAGEYGFNVFIDPHQDVWSRFSGGDGAPGWTLECAGLDMTGFKSTGAAVVHQTHGDPLPKMIWPSNSCKLAAATMFTLFFAGKAFAPATLVDGINIQDYLQDHFFAMMQKVANKLKGLDCVIGYDNFNEPQRGYVGVEDLRKRYGQVQMGEFPTPWQSMQLGAGFPQTVEILKRGVQGPIVQSHVILNPERVSAWLPGRTCVWRENGVWDIDKAGSPVLLRPHYFAQVDGRPANFIQDYLLPFTRTYAEKIHAVDPHAVIFAESETEQIALGWTEAPANKVAYTPHWYDGVVLMFKQFIPWLGSNLYTQMPIFGAGLIRKSYQKQLGSLKIQSKQLMGNVPVLVGEIGIPYDMDNKTAFRSGDFTRQEKAMNRSMLALESNLLNYTLWNYTADNNNERGDKWNDEDLSIFSRDQQKNPADVNSGGRALKAVIRPFPVATAGIPLFVKFDYRTGLFEFTFESDPSCSAPTVLFIPRLHYPNGINVHTTGGEIHYNETGQKLEYHTANPGIHILTIQPK